MTTFSLSPVERGPALELQLADTSIRNLMARPVEATGCASAWLVHCDTRHPLASAAHDAFYYHYPLIIRPDDIWFCIAQGFATHLKLNAQALRGRLVQHEGQKKLSVARPDFRLGQDNPWPEVFDAFSQQIRTEVGKPADLLAAHFSTSTQLEVAAFDICLMDGFQAYFEYELLIGCGIPEITVHGTSDDWLSMIPRLRAMAEYGLEQWVKALEPVLQQIAATASGQVDKDFWLSFFRYQSGSGPAELTGWLLTLFPYLIGDDCTEALEPNPYLANWHQRFDIANQRSSPFIDHQDIQGPCISRIPQALVSAPVRLKDQRTGEEHALRVVAGPFGVAQQPETLALYPAFGWAVVHDVPATTSRNQAEGDEPGTRGSTDEIDEVTGLWRTHR
ncbi:DUF4419 domain-containing protein [Chitinimonas viridis]|uniref:DUF4419 domain-containing protein n=1 Tax=Chitinimonas viridis TaxID=664880 RepID=A0ABT8B6Z9_9NEIS|nr:DUF4419 domain-containing protein [Chitinimonas viridis]MDN3578048.1 DUF4419 domain-containing protein [Chitinimonas viridis]